MSEPHLFDAYPHPRRSALIIWIKHGHLVTKHVVPYQQDFCIKAQNQSLAKAENLLAKDDRVEASWRDQSALWLRGPMQEVLRVRPKRLQHLHAVATDLRRRGKTNGFMFFDVDNQPESRWMHSQGLWTMCRLATHASTTCDCARHGAGIGPGQDHVIWPLRPHPDDERFTIEYPDPGLKTIWLDVEVEQRSHTPDFNDPLVAVRLGDTRLCVTGGVSTGPHEPRPTDGEASSKGMGRDANGREASERAVLRELGRRIRELDPDVIFTKHGDRFAIPYLLRRIRHHGLQEAVWLGRDRDPDPQRPDQEGKSISTYGRWLYKTAAYYLRGRWHIDLSKKTLDSEDDRKDIHGILYLARVSNRRAQDVNRNGAGYALQQMQIDAASDMGVALPWKRNLAEDWKDASTLCAVDRGGQIMVPTPGIYEDVAACDFSGYYPSLIVRHNLSSDTINCDCCPDGDIVPELGYHVCKQPGHQSEVLRRIAAHRKWAKAVLKRAR